MVYPKSKKKKGGLVLARKMLVNKRIKDIQSSDPKLEQDVCVKIKRDKKVEGLLGLGIGNIQPESHSIKRKLRAKVNRVAPIRPTGIKYKKKSSPKSTVASNPPKTPPKPLSTEKDTPIRAQKQLRRALIFPAAKEPSPIKQIPLKRKTPTPTNQSNNKPTGSGGVKKLRITLSLDDVLRFMVKPFDILLTRESYIERLGLALVPRRKNKRGRKNLAKQSKAAALPVIDLKEVRALIKKTKNGGLNGKDKATKGKIQPEKENENLEIGVDETEDNPKNEESPMTVSYRDDSNEEEDANGDLDKTMLVEPDVEKEVLEVEEEEEEDNDKSGNVLDDDADAMEEALTQVIATHRMIVESPPPSPAELDVEENDKNGSGGTDEENEEVNVGIGKDFSSNDEAKSGEEEKQDDTLAEKNDGSVVDSNAIGNEFDFNDDYFGSDFEEEQQQSVVSVDSPAINYGSQIRNALAAYQTKSPMED